MATRTVRRSVAGLLAVAAGLVLLVANSAGPAWPQDRWQEGWNAGQRAWEQYQERQAQEAERRQRLLEQHEDAVRRLEEQRGGCRIVVVNGRQCIVCQVGGVITATGDGC